MPSLRFQTTRATISLSQLIWDNQPTPCGQKGCTSMEYTPASAGNPPQTYRVEDVASILGISRKSAYNLTREGYFRVVRIGGLSWLPSSSAARATALSMITSTPMGSASRNGKPFLPRRKPLSVNQRLSWRRRKGLFFHRPPKQSRNSWMNLCGCTAS